MIGIVDYGLGNVQAFANIYKKLGIPAMLVRTAADIARAERIILPGVGAFDRAMLRLEESGMRPALKEAATVARKPLLGICVGMQMLATRSDEGQRPGLGWVPGEVKKFDVTTFRQLTHLPHMGWNDVYAAGEEHLFRGLQGAARFYFLHSFYFAPADGARVLATADYNGTFACGVRAGNVSGVQFHPEKSHQWGVQLLRNFAEMAPC
jgi:glutamine amidotransferase